MITNALTDQSRERRIAVAVLGLYLLGMVLLIALGRFAFVPKEVLLPALFIAPVLSNRLRQFLRDWIVFLAAIVLFDAIRGLSFSMVCAYDLPVHMGYVIDWEQTLLGGTTLPHLMQSAWLGGGIGWFEELLVIIHASHFLVFFLIGMLIWYMRPAEFPTFRIAILAVIYLGLVGYLLVPTVPPWMAAADFEVLPPLRHVTAEVYNLALPAVSRKFDTNPIAAMPSLHTALPVLLALVGVRHFGWRGLPVVVYAALVILSITYLGEHYLVDVIAGALLAIAVYLVVYRRKTARSAPARAGSPGLLRPRLIAAGLLLALTVFVASTNQVLGSGWLPSRRFVADQMAGKSPVADYYLGYYAYQDHDHAGVATAFERLPARLQDGHSTRMLALSYADLGRLGDAIELLNRRIREHPAEPEPVYLAARLSYQHGTITAAHLESVIRLLEQRFRDPAARDYAEQLRQLLRK